MAFSSVGWKDTICNVRDSGEFVVNLATRALAEQLNLSSAELASTEDELGFTGLDTLASQIRGRAARAAKPPCLWSAS